MNTTIIITMVHSDGRSCQSNIQIRIQISQSSVTDDIAFRQNIM